MRLYHLLSIPCLAAIAIAACDTGSGTDGICDAGANVFCRCRGGGAGTKKCNDTGDGFGSCETESGTCEEVVDDPDNPTNGGGGNVTAPPGEYMGPCTTGDDTTCKDGNVCPMGYCTKPCASYMDCGEGNDCVVWPPGGDPAQGLCMPYCIRQSDCEDFGMASRCGYTNAAIPTYDVVVCADWGDNLQFPPNGYPPAGACDSDDLCHLGIDGVERICGPGGCTDGCHDADDCSDPEEECSSVGGDVGMCTGGTTMENGDDCPGIPVTLTMSAPDTIVNGDTTNAIPPSEHACVSPCYASQNPPSEELVYQVTVTGASECSFSTPCTVTALLETTDSNYDPQLYVREQMCSDPSFQLVQSDEIGGGMSEIVEWCVFNNEDFWIFVDGWQGSTGAFQLSLNLASGCSG